MAPNRKKMPAKILKPNGARIFQPDLLQSWRRLIVTLNVGKKRTNEITPARTGMNKDATKETRMLKRKKNQYSDRDARPLNTKNLLKHVEIEVEKPISFPLVC